MIPRADSDHPIDKIRFGLMVAIGGEDASETVEQIAQQEQVAHRELEEVPQRAAARGDDFLEFSKESRATLLTQLETYLNWLTRAKQALEEQDSGELMQVYETSQEILPELNDALDAYSRDFSSFGPYKTPPANTLARILEGVHAGQAPKQAWKEYCSFYANYYAEKIETIGEIELPGRTNFKTSCQTLVTLLNSLEQNLPANLEAAGDSLSKLDTAACSAGLFELEVGSAQNGPTGIPATNVMIDYLKGWLAEALSKETLAGVVDDYADLMDRYAESFEDSASRPVDSALVQEEIPRTLDALDEHYAVIEDMTDGLGELDKEKANGWIDRLKSTAEPLEESADVYSTAARHQHHISCPSCSRSNPPENRNCEACGEVLPRPEDTGAVQSSTFSVLSGPILEENQQLEMTENIARLFQACDDVNDGVISPAEYSAELQRAALGLKEFSDELDGIAASALESRQLYSRAVGSVGNPTPPLPRRRGGSFPRWNERS